MIEFEQDESDEEPEPMETEQDPTNNDEQLGSDEVKNIETETIATTTTTTNTEGAATTTTTTTITENTSTSNENNEPVSNTTIETTQESSTIPGGHSAMLVNKTVSSVQQEEDDDDSRSITPKLDDISDVDNEDNDDEDNDLDSINDASKHPALAPHAHARMTDDDMTDSTAATPQTTTEENTPMPMLEDEPIRDQQPHPLSQEILSGASQFLNNNEDNDSSAIQTPEDSVSQNQSEVMEQ